MNSKIKDILDEMILSLEELSDEKIILKKRYREYYENAIKENKDLEDKDFYFSLIDMTEDYINIEDFKPNDMMTYLYEKNLHSINELERYALKLYKLYTDETHEKINYLEDIKSKRSEQIQEAKQKDIITVNEFELLYGYSSSSQKGFRSRLNDSIPFMQKGLNSKILYKKDEVAKWLEGKRR